MDNLFDGLSENDKIIIDIMLNTIDYSGDEYDSFEDEARSRLQMVYANHDEAMCDGYIDDIYCDDEKQVISNFAKYLSNK